jgi:hypothetical protein
MTEAEYGDLSDKLQKAQKLKSRAYILKSYLEKLESASETTVKVHFNNRKTMWTEDVPPEVADEVLDYMKLTIRTKLAQIDRDFSDL